MRENSTLPPKPRAEGSSPSAPAIDQGACKRLKFGVCGLFLCQNARLDTLYRYRIPVAKSSKRPNIREYSNCRRLVHHQKSISEIPEKDGSVPCAEDGDWRRKEMHLFCSTLLCMKRMICLTAADGCDKMGFVSELFSVNRNLEVYYTWLLYIEN